MSHSIDQKLIFAVRGNNLNLLMEQIAAGGDINYQDKQYGSALTEAINTENEEILQYLIEQGINLNLENHSGIFPLEVALHHASDDIVRKLSWSGAKISSRCRPHWKERLKQCLSNY